MATVFHIPLALLLDLVVGDPRWLPHPVRAMGTFARRLEASTRRLVRSERLAGVLTVLGVLGATALVTGGILHLAQRLPFPATDMVSIVLLSYGIAARDMVRHSRAVHEALDANDLALARKRVAMIVGRDTEKMDEAAVARATVESVAENLVDGVTAPLFFAALGGPLGIMLYKAASTMDSLFGYKNERYVHFGWAAARLDDVLNFIPARLTGLLLVGATALLGLQAGDSWRILRRDRLAHASPNSGHTEAAMAGALGIQLGGAAWYFGQPLVKPTMGDPIRPLEKVDIQRANRLFLATGLLAGLVLSGWLLWRQLG